METFDTAVAVFVDHNSAETAVKKLATAGFEMKNLSIVGHSRGQRPAHYREKPTRISTVAASGIETAAK